MSVTRQLLCQECGFGLLMASRDVWRHAIIQLCGCRPAQFVEETKQADRVAPWAIVWSVLATAVLGSSFLFTLLFCVQVRPPTSHSPMWLP